MVEVVRWAGRDTDPRFQGGVLEQRNLTFSSFVALGYKGLDMTTQSINISGDKYLDLLSMSKLPESTDHIGYRLIGLYRIKEARVVALDISIAMPLNVSKSPVEYALRVIGVHIPAGFNLPTDDLDILGYQPELIVVANAEENDIGYIESSRGIADTVPALPIGLIPSKTDFVDIHEIVRILVLEWVSRQVNGV